MISFAQILKSWLILISLTIIAVLIGSFFELSINHSAIVIASVMIIVVLKGQQIIDIFMELSRAPTRWRVLLMSYIVIIPIIIMLIYLW
jgi:cytochrome c oxidase subunit IV